MAGTNVSGKTVLVEHWARCDFYRGTKEQLIAAGIPAHWFPAELRKDSRGRTLHRYKVDGGRLRLEDRGRWAVCVEVGAEEVERRRAEEQRRAQQAAAEQDERFRRRLSARLKTLPAFAPGSMSEGEKHYVRLLRAMELQAQEQVITFAECMLVVRDEDQPPRATKTPTLRLIVDNDAPPDR